MTVKRKTLQTIIFFVMVFAMISGMAQTVYAAKENGEKVNLVNSDAIFKLDKTAPKEITEYPDDVYGVDTTQNLQGSHHNDENTNTPFLLSRQSELALLVGDNGDNGNPVMYRMDNLDFDQTALEENGNRWINGVNVANSTNSSMLDSKLEIYKELYYPQSVGLDREGAGRDQFIATIGLYSGYITLVIQDARTGSIWTKPIQKASWMGTGADWLKDNYFAITAGDYDGDGKDSVIVYVCGDGDNVKLVEYSYTGTGWSAHTILKLSDVLKETTFKTDGDMKYKPVVSLTTGDFDGDGGESFAYSAGYYNTSGNKADGYRNYSVNNLEQFATVVGVYDYVRSGESAGWSAYDPVWMYDRASTYKEQDKATGNKKYEITYMHAGVIAAGDVDGNGIDEIVACGYTDHNSTDHSSRYAKAIYSKSGALLEVDDIYNYSSNKQYVTSVVSKDKDGQFAKTDLQRTAMSTMQAYTWNKYCNDQDYEFTKLCIACAATNGNNAAEDVFISGILYDFSKYLPTVKYTPNIVTNELSVTTGKKKSDSSVNWIRNVAAGNFNGNDAGREQFVFTLWQKTKGQEYYTSNVGAVAGVEFNDKYKGKDVESYGPPQGYACNLNAYNITNSNLPIHGTDKEASQLMIEARSSNAVYAVPVAVDIDDDGLLGRFRSNGYVYTDPEVIAVLQAGPYFAELDEKGGYEDPCATSYAISTEYENGTSSSDNVSFEVGFAGEAGGPGFKTSLELGYAMDYSNSYEKSYSTQTTCEWTADKMDVVVMSRVPQLVYTYDLWDAEKGTWVIDGYNVKVPLSQRYYMLGIDDYNDFVSVYNDTLGPDSNYRMKEIVSGKDMPDNHEGIPDNYWENWGKAGTTGVQLSSTEWTLGYNSGAPKFSYSKAGSTSESKEISHGFHYSLTMQGGGEFGVGEAWAGGYVNLDYSHSTGSFSTTTNTSESGGQVQNLSRRNLINAGMTADQVNQYGFTWNFGKWTRPLTEGGPEVPFYGYTVYNVSRLPGPPTISGLGKINITEGYQETVRKKLPVIGEPAPTVTKVSGNEKITVANDSGSYYILVEPGLDLGTYKVDLNVENENGSSAYECTVIIKKNEDRKTAEKVAWIFRKLSLDDLEIIAQYDPDSDVMAAYNNAMNAYNALTEEQKKYLTAADLSKIDAAQKLVGMGTDRLNARSEADRMVEDFDRAAYELDSTIGSDNYLNELKDVDEAAQDFFNNYYPRLKEISVNTYNKLFSQTADTIYVFVNEFEGIDRLEQLSRFNERVELAYNYAKGRTDEGMIEEAYYNDEEAQQWNSEFENLGDLDWQSLISKWQRYLSLLTDEGERGDEIASLLPRSREDLYYNLTEALRYEKYNMGSTAEDYREQGSRADEATDVAALIDDLPKGDAVTAADAEAIRAAADAYAGLSDEQKALLGDETLNTLTAAQNRLEERLNEKTDISKNTIVKGISDKVYTGKAVTQTITVRYGSKTLKQGRDYTVQYKDNKNVGTAAAVLTGTGDYTGTVSRTFRIVPKKAVISKAVPGKKQVRVIMSAKAASTGGSAYQIFYRVKGKGKWQSATAKGKAKTIRKLKKGKKYQIKVRAYRSVGGTEYYGAWSMVKTTGKIK